MGKLTSLFCKHPDRHMPIMNCGYPLPCPYHTVVIEPPRVMVPIDRNVNSRQKKRLKETAEVLSEPQPKSKRGKK